MIRIFVCSVLVMGCAGVFAQAAPAEGVATPNRNDASAPGVYLAHEDIRGCLERVLERETRWPGGVPSIAWSGPCDAGLRDGAGMLKLYEGKRLLVASSGAYRNGYRYGPWVWEFPDGRRLEARFAGNGHEPFERVIETAKGERSRQVNRDGNYVNDPGVAPVPEPRALIVASSANSGAVAGPKRSDASSYAAAHFRVASCTGKGAYDPRSDYGATRRDVDRFVRDGEAAVRAEAESDLHTWSRALGGVAVRTGATLGGVVSNRSGRASELTELRERYDWLRCHYTNGLPYLARMQQIAQVCERMSLFKLDAVRASGNSRLQAEFADCIHAEIHSTRWAR